jgi:hypothetical protein
MAQDESRFDGMSENPYESPQVAASKVHYPIEPLSPTTILVLYIIVGVSGLGIGAASRLARPLFQGTIHYEALAELGIKVLLGFILVPVCRLLVDRKPLTNYWAASVCLWGGAFLGWSWINLRVWEDYFFLNLLWMFITASVGTVVLLVWSKLASRSG